MLGALVASGLFALIGTALRGLIRPVSWSLFAIAALFAASNQFAANSQSGVPGSTLVSSPGELSLSQAGSQTEPSPIETISPSSSEPLPIPQVNTEPTVVADTVPEALRGWQALPEQLEPAIAKVLGEESIQPKPPVAIISDTPPSPIAQASPVDRAINQPAASPPPAPRSPAPASPAPIKGFW